MPDLLSPTIFNVVVDTVVCHWGSLVAWARGGGGGHNRNYDNSRQPTEGHTIRGRNDAQKWAEERRARLKEQSDFFNAKNRMVASTNTGWLQTALTR